MHAGVARADHAFDDIRHRAADAFFHGRLPRIDALGHRAVFGLRRCEQAARFVEDGDAVCVEARRGAGHKVADRANLVRRQRIAPELQHDGGGRLLRLAREKLPLRQHQVYAR